MSLQQEIFALDETLDVLLNLRKSIMDMIGSTRGVLNKSEDETRVLHHMREIITLTELMQTPKYQAILCTSKGISPQQIPAPLENNIVPDLPYLEITKTIMSKNPFDFLNVYDSVCTQVAIETYAAIPILEILPGRAEGLAQSLPKKCSTEHNHGGVIINVAVEQYYTIRFEFSAPQTHNGLLPLKSLSIHEGSRIPAALNNPLFKIAMHSKLCALLRECIKIASAASDESKDAPSATALWEVLSWITRRLNMVDLACVYCGLQLRPLPGTSCVLPPLFWPFRVSQGVDSPLGAKLQAHLDCLASQIELTDN